MASRFRLSRRSYGWLCALGVLAPLVAVVAPPFVPGFPEGPLLGLAVFYLAVLTYPLGAVGSLVWLALVFSGVVSNAESLFLAAPVHVLLGYVQWFKLVPKAFGAGRAA